MDTSKPTESNTLTSLPSWTERAVLIYGPRKAGTTLLQNLHDGGELLVFPIELKLKELLQADFSDATNVASHYYDRQRIFQEKSFPNFDIEKYKQYSLGVPQGACNLRDFLRWDAYSLYRSVTADIPPPKAWGFKEVGGPTAQIVRAFRQHFFGAHVVMILRNPLMVSRSVVLDRRRKGIKMTLRRYIKEASDPVRVMYEQLFFLNARNTYFITYEQLTNDDVSGTMADICKFLDIPYSPLFDRPTIFGTEVVTRTSSRKTSEVFSVTQKWYEGLTVGERIVLWSVSKAAEHYYRRRSGRATRIRYCDVASLIKNRNHTNPDREYGYPN